MSETGPTGAAARACVFLDRDGTLNADVAYAHRPEQLVLLPGVAESLAALRTAGLLLIVVTNQSGVARGFYDEAAIARFHRHLDRTLGPQAAPDAYYYCPYHPDGSVPQYRQDSPLRKPNVGMFERACADFPVDVGRSFMIGDTQTDMAFAERAGLRGVLLAAAPDPRDSAASPCAPTRYLTRPGFAAAAQAVLDLHVSGRDAWHWQTAQITAGERPQT